MNKINKLKKRKQVHEISEKGKLLGIHYDGPTVKNGPLKNP